MHPKESELGIFLTALRHGLSMERNLLKLGLMEYFKLVQVPYFKGFFVVRGKRVNILLTRVQ